MNISAVGDFKVRCSVNLLKVDYEVVMKALRSRRASLYEINRTPAEIHLESVCGRLQSQESNSVVCYSPTYERPDEPGSSSLHISPEGLSGGYRPQSLYRIVTYYEGGNLLRVKSAEKLIGSRTNKLRGDVVGFSQDAHKRCLESVAQLDQRAMGRPVFVTLTYPGDFSVYWLSWKRDLDAMGKRIMRKWAGCAFIWKLELQERGAPHFHLLLWNGPKVIRKKGANQDLFSWFAESWADIVGSDDSSHVAAGTRVEDIKSVHGVYYYVAKYIGKNTPVSLGAEQGKTGRCWGWIGRQNRVISKKVFAVHERIFKEIRVVVREWCAENSRGYQPGGKNEGNPFRCFLDWDWFQGTWAKLVGEIRGIIPWGNNEKAFMAWMFEEAGADRVGAFAFE